MCSNSVRRHEDLSTCIIFFSQPCIYLHNQHIYIGNVPICIGTLIGTIDAVGISIKYNSLAQIILLNTKIPLWVFTCRIYDRCGLLLFILNFTSQPVNVCNSITFWLSFWIYTNMTLHHGFSWSKSVHLCLTYLILLLFYIWFNFWFPYSMSSVCICLHLSASVCISSVYIFAHIICPLSAHIWYCVCIYVRFLCTFEVVLNASRNSAIDVHNPMEWSLFIFRIVLLTDRKP